MDEKKAYDRVSREEFWKVLEEYEVCKYLLNCVKNVQRMEEHV